MRIMGKPEMLCWYGGRGKKPRVILRYRGHGLGMVDREKPSNTNGKLGSKGFFLMGATSRGALKTRTIKSSLSLLLVSRPHLNLQLLKRLEHLSQEDLLDAPVIIWCPSRPRGGFCRQKVSYHRLPRPDSDRRPCERSFRAISPTSPD